MLYWGDRDWLRMVVLVMDENGRFLSRKGITCIRGGYLAVMRMRIGIGMKDDDRL